MSNILYLVHRLPYPPNKGDKVRSFNILKYLSSRGNVFLGTFIDDPDDEKYTSYVDKFCKQAYFEKINKNYSKISSLLGFIKGDALTLNYYNSQKFHSWVTSVVGNNKIDAVVVFSSVMAQFVNADLHSRTLVDFVDVDSKKWNDYAEKAYFPFSWIYKRESIHLLSYERYLASHVSHSFFVTEKERSLFSSYASESVSRTSALNNGVDSNFFSQQKWFLSPFDNFSDEFLPIVFTGAMDYWPNIDAVIWFAENIFPMLIKVHRNIRFYIVGRNPSQSVLNLKSKSIFITGTVKDVRPYIQHATVVVAPLRIARGIQNKILEAMSMAKPVVASCACVDAIDCTDGVDIYSAEKASDFIRLIDYIINNKNEAELVGSAARRNILEKYSWDFHLKGMNKYINFEDVENL